MTQYEALTKKIHQFEDKVNDQKKYIEYYSEDFTASQMKKEQAKLEKYEAELEEYRVEFEALPKLEDVPAIKAYLEDFAKKMIAWIERCHEEYPKKYDEIQEKEKAFMNEHPEYNHWGNLSYNGRRAFEREYAFDLEELEDLRAGHRMYERRFEIVARDVEIRYINLVESVKKITGKITDASFLRVNEKGSLDGYITGENGKAKVNTFEAGGWNIQRFHYRTKITEIK